MTDLLEYKGYHGSVRYSGEDEIFHGRIEFIRDLVTYEGRDAKGLKRAFEEAVDDYIALAARQGREPDTPLKGSFNVRTGPDLHRKAMILARKRDTNLNTVVTEALKTYLEKEERRD
ncbi:MAG: type II toxin-antitoxin system HicB family antitoxin [Parvibaculum sp.]|uniref:type II toxin-antitoxin system HicB family antitoxin n=1 Tax=Parvibaculum sp. TaxID=2024848 RepID=UPI002ABB3153|nr:type II toxin-antitoxin system HicB family antitoxin [Parvibaculum sp.]MDZ4380889.1 type II toxin-antitoxin system HicB family antitoxin [Parvibaculum sp.]